MEELTKDFIEKGNRLITNFIEPNNKVLFVGIEFIDLQYHKSYDWLMPVLEKIENTLSLEKDNSYYSSDIQYSQSVDTNYEDENHPFWVQQDLFVKGEIKQNEFTAKEPKIYDYGYTCCITKVDNYSRNLGVVSVGKAKDRLTAIYIAVVKFIDWIENY